jgi:hypothetical protein
MFFQMWIAELQRVQAGSAIAARAAGGLQLSSVPQGLRWCAGDRHHDAIYRK